MNTQDTMKPLIDRSKKREGTVSILADLSDRETLAQSRDELSSPLDATSCAFMFLTAMLYVTALG